MKKVSLLKACTTLLMILSMNSVRAQYNAISVNSQNKTKGVHPIASDNNGNIIISGHYLDTLSIGGITVTNSNPDYGYYGGNAAFIGKMLTNGSYAWVQKITGNKLQGKKVCSPQIGYVAIQSVSTDSNGDIYLTGTFGGSVNFGAITLVSLQSASGACGTYSQDIFTAKLSTAGVFLWAKAEGGNSGWSEWGYGVTSDASGNVYTTGTLIQNVYGSNTCYGLGTPQYYIYVVKYSPSGTKIWERKYSSSSYACTQLLTASSIVSDGINVYVAGSFFGTVNFGSGYSFSAGNVDNLVLLKLNGSGTTLWAKAVPTKVNSSNLLTLANNNLDLYVSTRLSGTASFGSVSLTSNHAGTGGNYVLARYSTSNGNCSWAVNAGYSGGGRAFTYPNGNIGMMVADSGAAFTIKEFSTSGSQVSATIATNLVNFHAGATSIVSSPGGFTYAQNLRGSYDFGGATISSSQPLTSIRDIFLVQYTAPPPPAAESLERIGSQSGHNSSGKPMKIYPNPTEGRLRLESDETIGHVLVLDIYGRQLSGTTVDDHTTELDLASYPAGTYFIKTQHNNAPIRIQKW